MTMNANVSSWYSKRKPICVTICIIFHFIFFYFSKQHRDKLIAMENKQPALSTKMMVFPCHVFFLEWKITQKLHGLMIYGIFICFLIVMYNYWRRRGRRLGNSLEGVMRRYPAYGFNMNMKRNVGIVCTTAISCLAFTHKTPTKYPTNAQEERRQK